MMGSNTDLGKGSKFTVFALAAFTEVVIDSIHWFKDDNLLVSLYFWFYITQYFDS